jgi:integrase
LKPLPGADSGYEWTDEDIETLEAAARGEVALHFPKGCKLSQALIERAAEWLTVLLYTGTRRGDASMLNDDMIFDAIDPETGKPRKVISFIPEKGAGRKRRKGKDPVRVIIPLLPPLEALLKRLKRAPGDKRWIIGVFGRGLEGKTLTTEMGRVCKYLGLPECTPHGLRRAGAARAAAAGASHADLMAMFGWETMTQPDRYIKRFERQRAAMRSMHLVGVPQRAPQQRRPSTAA